MDKNLEIMQREMTVISKNFLQSIENYKKTLDDLATDVPIEVLCLPDNIVKILNRNNLFRVKDLIRSDLRKIKGLGIKKIGIIEFRLSQFIGM